MNEREGVVSAGVFVEMDVTEALTFEEREATGDVYVKRPSRTPLSEREGHAELVCHTDAGTVTVELDAQELDGLADALHQVQKFHTGE